MYVKDAKEFDLCCIMRISSCIIQYKNYTKNAKVITSVNQLEMYRIWPRNQKSGSVLMWRFTYSCWYSVGTEFVVPFIGSFFFSKHGNIQDLVYFNPNHLGPYVCIIYDAHNSAHLEGPGGVPSLQKLMLKESQTPGPSKCAAFNGAQHIFSPAKLFQNMIAKSVHHFGTTAGVIIGF